MILSTILLKRIFYQNVTKNKKQNQIAIIFVRQPELSTIGGHGKLLSAVYSYFAEAEQKYISMRTKQGLAALKAAGKELGRPKGSQNKKARDLTSTKIKL